MPHKFLVAAIALTFISSACGEDPKLVPLTEVAKHVDQTCTVELTIQSSRRLADRNICFLNSERNHRDEKNFTTVIMKDGLEKFKAAGIADPASHFQGKKVRVTGKITLHESKPQIKVETVAQIELVKEKSAGK